MYDLLFNMNDTKSLFYKRKVKKIKTNKNSDISYDELHPGDFRYGQCIGYGGFGKVYSANSSLAVKVMKLSFLREKKQAENISTEIHIAEFMGDSNKYLVNLISVWATPIHLLMIFNKMPYGDLYTYVQDMENNDIKISDNIKKKIFLDVAAGINYLHTNRIVHRDIKPENLLIDSEGHIRICDFGLAKIIKKFENKNTFCQGWTGTVFYRAPEVVKKKRYGIQVDWWGLGVVMYLLGSFELPFFADGKTRNKIHADILENGEIISKKLVEMCSFLDKIDLLSIEPKYRTTYKNITKKFGKYTRENPSPILKHVTNTEITKTIDPKLSKIKRYHIEDPSDYVPILSSDVKKLLA